MFDKLLNKIYQQFPALRHRNYRLYFAGQLISLTGSWLQGVAQGWLVYTLTQSPFWLGVVSAVSALPVLFLSLYGGFLVDRINRKKLLMITQSSSLILALALGILTLTNLINLPILLVITLLSGIANAIDNPANQAFVVDVVGKEDLPSAVGLNSAIFNSGRVLGPAAAGFLIALVGMGNIFLINAVSFLAILVSLYFIKINIKITKPEKEDPVASIKEGIGYSFSHPLISLLLITAAMGAIFCFSQATIMPVLAEQIFHQGITGLGRLLSATGLGALVGSLVISSLSKRISTSYFIALGYLLFMIFNFAFTYTSSLQMASIYLFFSGLGLTLQFSTIYAFMQKLVKDEFRGRVSSIYVLLFIGLSPFGSLFIGSTTSWFGPQLAIRLCLVIIAIFGAWMLINLPQAKRKYFKLTGRTEANQLGLVNYQPLHSLLNLLFIRIFRQG